MSVVGADSFVTAGDVRAAIRDNDPKANLLLDDLEFSVPEIETALTDAVDYWNETSPAIRSYDWPRFPYRFNLKQAAIARLLYVAAHRFRRNTLALQIAGGAVSDQDKAPLYEQAADRLWETYQRWVTAKKYELNIEQGWGSV
jgi:hypothetical protein